MTEHEETPNRRNLTFLSLDQTRTYTEEQMESGEIEAAYVCENGKPIGRVEYREEGKWEVYKVESTWIGPGPDPSLQGGTQ